MADDNSYLGALASPTPDEATVPAISPLWPNYIKSIMDIPKHLIDTAAQAPPAGLRREDVTDIPGSAQPIDPLVKATTDQAISMAGSGMPMAETGAAGIFGGKLAKTADLRSLDTAMTRVARGDHPNEVRMVTGWEQNPIDKQWRFEIPDNKAAMAYMPPSVGDKATGSVSSLMSHPDLFKNYPDLKGLRLDLTKTTASKLGPNDTSLSGSYYPQSGPVPPRIEVGAPNYAGARTVGLHELQHGVQDIEGFTPGSDPSYFAPEFEKLLRSRDSSAPYDFDKIKEMANLAYYRTAGEVEARNVEARKDFSPLDRLMKPSWQTQSVPYEDQVNFANVLRELNK